MTVLANVILATVIPYVMVLMFCFVVVPVEVGVFFAYQRRTVRLWSSLWLIVTANVVSWLIGIVLVGMVPAPSGFWGPASSEPAYRWGVALGFVLAYLISCLVEHRYLWLFRHRFTFTRLPRSVAVCNLVSYAAIACITVLWH